MSKNKISQVFGLFPPVVAILRAHGCKIEKWEDHEGTLKVPAKSFILDWPGDRHGLGLVRTPSGAYVMWGQYPTGRILHFAGAAPWSDDQMLVHEIHQTREQEPTTAKWLMELIRLRMFRLITMKKGGVEEVMCEMALRSQKRPLN